MNRDQIIAKWNGMTPRERDAWVAEVVFGWVRCEPVEGKSFILPPPDDERCNWAAMFEDGIPHYLPRYSEDIAAVWTVLEEIANRPNWMLYRIGQTDVDGPIKFECTFLEIYRGVTGYARATTAPEAICLAAILAKLTEPV